MVSLGAFDGGVEEVQGVEFWRRLCQLMITFGQADPEGREKHFLTPARELSPVFSLLLRARRVVVVVVVVVVGVGVQRTNQVSA
jgi:hypothetical protein